MSVNDNAVGLITYLIQVIDMVEGTLAAVAIVLVARCFFHVLVQPALSGKAGIAYITFIIVRRCMTSVVVLI